jgi:5-methylcytosine-specific restriction endonuclease McrA
MDDDPGSGGPPLMPCLDCGALARGTRCKSCQRLRERSRPTYRAAYQDRAYRATRTALRGSTCVLCGLGGSDSVGHTIPLAKGGTNDLSNLAPEHLVCPNGITGNLRKGAEDPQKKSQKPSCTAPEQNGKEGRGSAEGKPIGLVK